MRETENSRRYRFADFTRQNYAALLRLALRRYTVRTYVDFSRTESFLIWRHDIDFSLHAALKLAEIEASEGLVATYFFLLHSEFYNFLEGECIDLSRRILSLGHRLGLHFDHQFWTAKGATAVEHGLQLERNLLQDVLERPVEAVSFHIPDAASSSWDADSYGGMVNTYSSYFKNAVGYCSDSNGYWRFRRLEDVLAERADSRLQVLTHPEYWQEEIMSPRQRVERCIVGRAEKTRAWYRGVLARSGREDIDW